MSTSQRKQGGDTLARWRVWCAIASMAMVGFFGLTGCGSEAVLLGHLERRLPGQPWAPWAGRVGPIVAHLDVTGGQPIVFVVVECRDEPQCHEVGYFTQPAYKDGERTLNEGPRVNHPEPIERNGDSRVLDSPGVSYMCDGGTSVAVLDGLLRQSQDAVTDSSDGTSVIFKKVPIPVRFHPEGILVYGALLARANTLTVRSSYGTVVAREHLLGAGEEPGFTSPVTRRSCKAS
jgi:hypothetical protein